MLKTVLIASAALAIAVAATLYSAPPEVKTAVVGPAQAAANGPADVCAKREWPYSHCVGTPAGNLRVRLITTDHLPQ